MSHPRMRKPRPLGSLRHITKAAPEKIPVMPNVLPEISKDNEKLKEGIHGNAMTVPPPQVETGRRSSDDRPRSDQSKKPPKSSASSSSVVSHENCEKDIKEGLRREKDLKNQIDLLQKQIAELQVALRGKEEDVAGLLLKLETQAKEHERQIQSEQTAHEQTRTTLDQTIQSLNERNDLIGRMGREHAEALEMQKKEMEKKLQETIAAKDVEIADRDQKLSRLKSQMADALKGNSWERQQQLEELTKELSRIQEECDLLRMKIKSMSKNKQTHCSNCDDINSKLSKAQATVKERDETVKELKSLCSKFESQLSKQDKLLEQWAASKGHKLTAPK